MAVINNYEVLGHFFIKNKPFIKQYYFEHFHLLKVHERLKRGEFKGIDAFSITDGVLCVLFLATEVGIQIYCNGFNEDMIDLLYKRVAERYTYTNIRISGHKGVILALLKKYDLPYEVEKDRIIYETDKVLPLKKKHLGKAVKSGSEDFEKLVQYSYDYSLEEWGEREGRGIDYVQGMVWHLIQEGNLLQYDTSYGIGCIAQILNLEDRLPIIGSLYTPKESRGKGYATMLVHAATKKLLEGGFSKCGIISDTTNPATNKLFKNVGYIPVYEHLAVLCRAFKGAI